MKRPIEDKIESAIKKPTTTKSPGPGGLTGEFYQIFNINHL